MTFEQLFLFLPSAALVAAAPGANNLLSLSHGAVAGLRPTIVSLAGRFCAFALLLTLVATGLGAVLAASETAFVAVKWLGVAYLAYLGLRMWRTAPMPRDMGHGRVPRPQLRAARLARKEFTVALTNPKALLLFTAFVPQFVQPGEDATLQLFVLGALYVAVEFCMACLYAAAGAVVRLAPPTAARQRMLDRATGTLMLAAAAALATARAETDR
jgi:threonine/homoserine/homoserine lactone efflux protein